MTGLFTPETFGPFNTLTLGGVTGLLAALLGWQINLVALNHGVQRGRTATFFVGAGATLGDMILLLAGFTGATPLLYHPEFLHPLKWVGVATILLLAGAFLFKKTKKIEEKKRRDPARNFLVGFLVVIANPAVFLIWIGVMSFLLTHFPHADILKFKWLFLAGFFGGSSLWFLLLAMVILGHVRQWGEERLHLISKVSAVALLVAGVILIFEKF